MTELHGRIVLVTGATSGIGAACAEAFAAEGCQLLVCGRREGRLRALAERLEAAHGTRVHAFVLDVRDQAAVATAIAAVPAALRGIDVLVNNAGLSRGMEPLHQGSIADWDEMIDTNVKGLLYVTRAVVPGMVERGSGHVIQIGSIAGHEVYPGGNVYCASKYAVLGLTRALRLDLCGTGVRVSTVDPGLVNTEFSTVRFHGDQERAEGTYRGMTPLSGADVAAGVVWTASRPAHVNAAELLLLPSDQASPTRIHRRES
ncbi:MAG TPA: SDR family NAD(P)-dependent oxidoreductase [Planctomycetota bacterium]